MPTLIFIVVLACLFGAAMLGILSAAALPQRHLNGSSKDVIYAFMNVIALLAAVVLGLLTYAAKTSFDSKDAEWKHAAANIVLLDRVLAHYGPEAKGTRELLREVVSKKLAQLEDTEANTSNKPIIVRLEEVQDDLRALLPASEAQRLVQSRALEISGDIARARWFLVEEVESSVPLAFLLILVLWLMIIFFSYGLFAEKNATVISVIFFCAASLAGSIYLVMDMDDWLEGPISISIAPLSRALEQLGQ